MWEQAVEAGLPVVFHVGGGIRAADDRLLDRDYFANGGPPVPDFHGGDENFRSIDYMAIPTAPMQTLATLIFDGVLDRFPALKLGVIEQGASWIPSWMRFMESAFEAFRKNEERLQKLALRPSEYVRRQVRATPYPAEDVGWIVANAGDEVCLFSSDYPHVEGGRNPIKRFEESMALALRAAEAALLRRQLRRPDGARAAGSLGGADAGAPVVLCELRIEARLDRACAGQCRVRSPQPSTRAMSSPRLSGRLRLSLATTRSLPRSSSTRYWISRGSSRARTESAEAPASKRAISRSPAEAS